MAGDGTWQAEVMTRMAWFEAIMWTADRQIAISNKINTWNQNALLFGLLGKAYGMTLVVIVDDYSVFISKTSLSWEDWWDKWIAVPFKTRGTSVILVLIVSAYSV